MTCERRYEVDWWCGTPRILLKTFRIVQHSPSLESRGSDALDEGVTLGLRKRHSQNPLGVRLCDACDTCDGSFGALSASVGRGFGISFSVLIARSSSKLPVTPVTRVTKPCSIRLSGVTLPKASRHSRHWKRHSLTPVPYLLVHPNLTAPTNRAGSSIEPAPASLYSLQSLQLPSSYCHTATKPIEDTVIASNNGYITIALNIIKLQSKYW